MNNFSFVVNGFVVTVTAACYMEAVAQIREMYQN